MLKIAVFGFFEPDHDRINHPDSDDHISPASTDAFMRQVWRMEPSQTRAPSANEAPCFVKLSAVASRPMYVQSLSDRMAPGAALLNCDGYIAIIDAVKILAPKTIRAALERLYAHHQDAHVIIAAARQDEPDAFSSDDLREMLGLHPDLPIYPFSPEEGRTVKTMIADLAAAIEDSDAQPAPPLAGMTPPDPKPAPEPVAETAPAKKSEPAPPRIGGVAGIALRVSNLDRALEFYRGLLGFRVLGHVDVQQGMRELTVTHLETGNARLQLFSFANETVQPVSTAVDVTQAGLQHLVVPVNQLDAIVEQLACADVTFTLEPSDVAGTRIAFCTDPDGTPIALTEGDFVYSRR